jgi:hypothetical protein
MKNERRIIIRNERLKKTRNNLRALLRMAVYDKIEILRKFDSLYEGWLELTPEEQKEVALLQGKKHKLYDLLDKSICVCPLCSKADKDMIYIADHDTWYCIECQEKDLIWYPSHGSEEDRRQHDYINWYLELKEKFTKKDPSKDRKDYEK